MFIRNLKLEIADAISSFKLRKTEANNSAGQGLRGFSGCVVDYNAKANTITVK